MATEPKSLSPRSATILRLIAAGHSYEHILAADPELTYLDIFAAAREALEVAGQTDGAYAGRLAAIQERHPRAYAPWSSEEDLQLRQLVEAGQSVEEISARLQRQPSAIRSRVQRLGLQAGAAPPKEQPLHDVMEFYGRGRASWDGTDAQEYVNRLRSEWSPND
jgi:DNA-binding NarL/FixJ family response regulator